jgi:hypothetical protein
MPMSPRRVVPNEDSTEPNFALLSVAQVPTVHCDASNGWCYVAIQAHNELH